MNKDFIKFGKGPKNVLLLHGWGFNTEASWQEFMNINLENQDFTYYFFKFPGLDGISLGDIDSTYKFAEYFLSKIKHYKLKFDFILAHSFGCKVSTIMCAELKFKPKKIVFLGAAGLEYKLTWFESFKKKLSSKFSFFKKIKFLKGVLSSSDYKKVQGTGMAQVFKNVIKENLAESFKKINIPTLLIYGTKDSYTPVYIGEGINSLIKKSKLRIIKGANHGLHIHYTEMINNLAQEFYSSN